MIISRRAFIGGTVALLAAPAIVRASSIMPVRVPSTSSLREGLINLTRKVVHDRIFRETVMHGGVAPDFVAVDSRSFGELQCDFISPSEKLTILGVPVYGDCYCPHGEIHPVYVSQKGTVPMSG